MQISDAYCTSLTSLLLNGTNTNTNTLRANHETVQRLMEDMELSVLNQDLTQI